MRLVVACFVCFWIASAQPSPATVEVRVLDNLVGLPLREVQVKLSQTGKRRVATSGLSGRIAYRGLEAGPFAELTAEKLSVLWVSYGARRPQRVGTPRASNRASDSLPRCG